MIVLGKVGRRMLRTEPLDINEFVFPTSQFRFTSVQGATVAYKYEPAVAYCAMNENCVRYASGYHCDVADKAFTIRSTATNDRYYAVGFFHLLTPNAQYKLTYDADVQPQIGYIFAMSDETDDGRVRNSSIVTTAPVSGTTFTAPTNGAVMICVGWSATGSYSVRNIRLEKTT